MPLWRPIMPEPTTEWPDAQIALEKVIVIQRVPILRRGEEVTEQVLNNVVIYTIQHFATEERLMQERRTPGTTAHMIEHNTLDTKTISASKGTRRRYAGYSVQE